MSAPTPFRDLDQYIAIPRLSGLTLSPSGDRLVTAVASLDPKRTRWVTAIWEVDPDGKRLARRLTRSAKGESGAAFAPDGSVLFVSARPDPDADPAEDAMPALWCLPAGGGEASVLATRPGGVSGVVVARDSGAVAVASATLPGAVTATDDAERRAARRDGKVSAILHESYPVRFWDHDLGPDRPRLLVGAPGGGPGVELRDVTGHVGGALADESSWELTPDGRTLVVGWNVTEAQGSERYTLVAVDVASGQRSTLLSDPDHEYLTPVISPDGTRIALSVQTRPTPQEPPDVWLAVLDLPADGGMPGEPRALTRGWDRWPGRPAWTPDGAALIVPADSGGGAPLFRVDLDGTVTRLTGDHGAYSDICVSPDGEHVYALRAAVDAPPAPIRLDPRSADQQPEPLPSPVEPPVLPGRLDAVTATAEDGSALRSWLVLPDGAGAGHPAPLLLWIHGGPLGSWNSWSWRWNPWVAAAAGYAVLLPDPALSTGYGQDFIRRGWGRWGGEPFTDLMAITDAAVARLDVDQARTAAMGGSFGGYMANWVAGHTDRFAGIVTHASLWALDQFGPTTDAFYYWRREISAEMIAQNSPHLFVDRIRTPMLVIHGDKDYRVPIGEALRLWAELAEHSAAEDGSMPHKFLYFPDENHWILTPQHAKVWYATVLAFLDSTVHGKPWVAPDILR